MNQTAPKRRNKNQTKVLIYPPSFKDFSPQWETMWFFPIHPAAPHPTPSSSTAWTVPEQQHQSRSPPVVNGFPFHLPLAKFIWIYVHMFCIFFHPFTPWTLPNLPKNIQFSTIHYLYTIIHSIHSTFIPISTPFQYPFTPLLTFIPLNPTFYPYFTPFLESTKIWITE